MGTCSRWPAGTTCARALPRHRVRGRLPDASSPSCYTDDDPYLDSDAVFGVKPSLVVHYDRVDSPEALQGGRRSEPYWDLEYDFILTPGHASATGFSTGRQQSADIDQREDTHANVKPPCPPQCGCQPAFARTSLPGRIVFGDGALDRLADELDQRDLRERMLIAADYDASWRERGRNALGERVRLSWDEVRQHVPRELAERATGGRGRAGIDVLVAIGGGSTTGLGKAVAVVDRPAARGRPHHLRGQ